MITTVIASSIEITRFTFAHLFCMPMNKKILQYVDQHKQKLNDKEKIFENNILIYYFHIKNWVELVYVDQQIAKVFYHLCYNSKTDVPSHTLIQYKQINN